MIKYVNGDILLTKAEALAHGVAPHDDFKQGLALSLREQWPSLYNDFRHYCKTQSPSEGEVWTWKGAGGPLIFNLMTQEAPEDSRSHPGKASETHVNHTLKALAKELKVKKVKSLAITKLATGVGGLDWKTVKPLIEKHLGDLGVEVHVYEQYTKGKAI
jgi:O-acetyl-ADP-ribose deacetylase (regulator of RNase III)